MRNWSGRSRLDLTAQTAGCVERTDPEMVGFARSRTLEDDFRDSGPVAQRTFDSGFPAPPHPTVCRPLLRKRQRFARLREHDIPASFRPNGPAQNPRRGRESRPRRAAVIEDWVRFALRRRPPDGASQADPARSGRRLGRHSLGTTPCCPRDPGRCRNRRLPPLRSITESRFETF